MKLESVEIAKLRGIPGGWPDLAIGDKGLVVYGPNGVGKSSIIDALEATIARRSTLFERERLGVSWDAAAAHVKGGPPVVVIRGKLKGKPLQLTLGQDPDADLQGWVSEARTASFVLRRYMLLRFIDTVPADRYAQIEPFLNLESFTTFENGLKEFARGLETRLAAASTSGAARAQVIRQTFGLGRDVAFGRAQLVAILQEHLKGAGLASSDADVADLSKLNDLLNIELGGEEPSKKLAALGAAKQHAQQLTSASLLLPLYEQVLAAADELEQELRSSAQKAPVQLLEQALVHARATNADTCPVCERPVDPTSLIERLDERIRADEAVSLSASTLKGRLDGLRKATAVARQSYAAFATGWAELGLESLPSCYAAALNLFDQLEALAVRTAGDHRDTIRAQFPAAECDPADQITAMDAAIVAVGGGDRRSKLVEAVGFVSSLLTDVNEHEIQQKEALKRTKQKFVADKLHAHAEAARKSAVQKIADLVATQANVFYDEIHPGEGIATSALVVRQATSASMLLNTTFHGRDAPPLLYYSESHLDTLGLCYFLAIRKLEVASSPQFKLLLVDDVLHSVDAEHRTRLARLLKNNFADHQLVLVTHDKHFYDRLRAILGGGYKYVAISGWDIELGPKMSDPSTDLDRVIDPSARAGKSHDELAAAGGRFFEWLLKGLTERLEVSITARFSREHDIGSMWPSLIKKLNGHKDFVAKHPRLLSELNDNVWVRNKIGAHDNEVESSITPPEVTNFVDQLAALYRATTCKECSSTVQKSKAADVWRCDCSKLQYE